MIGLLGGLSDENNRSLFFAGFWDILPIHLGTFPFAIIIGITGIKLGFTFIEITVMSAILFAGTAQLPAIFLMAEGIHIMVVTFTVFMINIRFIIYSISLAPIFQPYSRLRKAVYSFFVADPLYALSIPRFRDPEEDGSHWYYFGGGVSLWSVWVLGIVIGAGVGVEVPEEFPFELVLPLVLIALLFQVLEDRSSWATAAVAGGVASVAAPLNYNLGLLLGVTCGLVLGVSLNR